MEEAVGRPLKEVVDTDHDDVAEFTDLLNSRANPFASWEAQRDELAGDWRYISLSTNGARLAAFTSWKQAQIAATPKDEHAEEPAKFVEFVHAHHAPRMLYALFKRKFRNSPEFAQCKLADKEKEALFREYTMVSNIKDEAERRSYMQSKPAFARIRQEP